MGILFFFTSITTDGSNSRFTADLQQMISLDYSHIIPILYHNEMQQISGMRTIPTAFAARRTVKSLVKQLGLEHPETRELDATCDLVELTTL